MKTVLVRRTTRSLAGLVLAAAMSIACLPEAVALPIGPGNTGTDWNTACKGAAEGKYACCQKKYNDCAESTSKGTPGRGQCSDAYKTCYGAKLGAAGSVRDVQAPVTRNAQ